MSLRPLYGHEPIRAKIAGSIARGRFPQAALFVGGRGVGKQRLALWTAQAFLCDGSGTKPCGSCISCRQVVAMGHPDAHWFVPIERLQTADTDRQMEEVRGLLAADVAARVADGLWAPPEGMVSHPLASMHVLQHIVSRTPFAAPRKVIILGDAERLVVQESSLEAANALLKVLEEPPADTTIILTAEHPHALLPTIMSRLVPLRVPALQETDLEAFAKAELALEGPRLERLVPRARGSIGELVRLAQGPNAPEEAADALWECVRRGDGAWLAEALPRNHYGARGELQPLLDALARRIRTHTAELARGGNREAIKNSIRALKRVEAARAETRVNVNPQLAVAVLAGELERLL
ncbi:MAG TPA: hypothetical protein VGA22_14325 [Gemmatimonadales bacterium]|jgi:DNA polymerase-3 subunit delta'